MVLDSKYELTKLLGDGTFGRVVLARDGPEDRYVAIKVIRDVKKYRENARIEAGILKSIGQAGAQGGEKCSVMYGTFLHEGRFFCLVFEPLGASLYMLLKENAHRGFWLQDLQSFASQCLGALAFLHRVVRLTHTDLKPENILLQSMEAARPSHFPRETFWQDVHGAATQSPYLRPADTRVKLIDFGNATYEHEHHSSTISTRQYRSPEVILESGWDELSDIWSLGCIVMELYTGDLLFQTHENLEHLALMERILGSLPAAVLEVASPCAKDGYLAREDGQQSTWRLRWPAAASSSASARHVHEQRPLPALAPRHHQLLIAFVKWLLAFDRRERPSALEALRHPFLGESFSD